MPHMQENLTKFFNEILEDNKQTVIYLKQKTELRQDNQNRFYELLFEIRQGRLFTQLTTSHQVQSEIM